MGKTDAAECTRGSRAGWGYRNALEKLAIAYPDMSCQDVCVFASEEYFFLVSTRFCSRALDMIHRH